MISKIISGVLIIVTAVLQLKHFWDGLHIDKSPEALKMLAELNINRSYIPYFGVATILVAVLVLFPKTFFIANLLNALTIVMIMALALRADNYSLDGNTISANSTSINMVKTSAPKLISFEVKEKSF